MINKLSLNYFNKLNNSVIIVLNQRELNDNDSKNICTC